MSNYSKVIVYPKDVAVITGKGYRTSWVLLRKIRTFYKKEDHQVITMQEFCDYMGMKVDEVIKILG